MTSRTPIGTVTCSSSKSLAIRVRRKTRPTLSCEEAAICRRPIARLFNLDVERLKRFSRGAASLPEEVWRAHDEAVDLGGLWLFYWTHGTVLGTDMELRGSQGDKDISFTQLFWEGQLGSIHHHVKVWTHPHPWRQQFQFQKFVICISKPACSEDTYHSVFIIVGNWILPIDSANGVQCSYYK